MNHNAKKRHSNMSGIHDDVDSLKNTVYSIADKIKTESRERSDEVLEHTRSHPIQSMGIAMGVGIILGVFLKKLL